MIPSLRHPVIFTPATNTARYHGGKTVVAEQSSSHRLVFATHKGAVFTPGGKEGHPLSFEKAFFKTFPRFSKLSAEFQNFPLRHHF
jgi:hypothetical protein